MTLPSGVPAPYFWVRSHQNPNFAFSSVAGRYVLLGFLPEDAEARREALRVSREDRALLDDHFAAAFLVVRDGEAFERARDGRGLRWFHDPDGAVARLYDASEAWVLIDPSLRILQVLPITATQRAFALLRSLPPPDGHAGVPLHAPVLIAPRIFEPAFCSALIDHYEARGGQPSGTMQEVAGRTVGVLSSFKKRRDATITCDDLQAGIRARLLQRLLPEIEKAFQFRATRIERYIVACYDAGEGGYFRPHRDNTTAGTAHRKFAVSINLNADFEGGDLRFAEFGGRTYRAPPGGAVVFSCSLLHEATPVTRGVRYACLPFLYDDAGAELRARNQHLLGPTPSEEAAAVT